MAEQATAPKRRRRRRSQAEVQQRLAAAAHTMFSERGYAATTTRDIAQSADVSETLLFRYYGTKAALFDHVVFTPFETMVDSLFTAQAESQDTARGAEMVAGLGTLLSFLDNNRSLLNLVAARGLAETDEERVETRLRTMRRNYRRAAERLAREQQTRGGVADVAPDLAVRLAFGMILAASLFAEWLFPEGEPDRATLTAGIERLLLKALAPAVKD